LTIFQQHQITTLFSIENIFLIDCIYIVIGRIFLFKNTANSEIEIELLTTKNSKQNHKIYPLIKK
jgi:hypothetical protein